MAVSMLNHDVNETINVERGIPMPAKMSGIPEPKYPWAALRVGDSFFIANTKKGPGQPPKRLNIKIASRSMDGGIRVWRIA